MKKARLLFLAAFILGWIPPDDACSGFVPLAGPGAKCEAWKPLASK